MTTQPFSRIQIAQLEGRPQSVRLRQSLFHALHIALTASEGPIKRAIAADSGCSDADAAFEYSLALSELRTHYDSLDLKTEIEFAHALENPKGTTTLGIVYVIPTQRNLFYSVLSPLCAAVAGGNCVVLEVRPTILKSALGRCQSSPLTSSVSSCLRPCHRSRACFASSYRRRSMPIYSLSVTTGRRSHFFRNVMSRYSQKTHRDSLAPWLPGPRHRRWL